MERVETGIICDRRIATRLKGRVYEMVVTLAMMYGLTELQILIVSEQDGQDQKRVHHRDSWFRDKVREVGRRRFGQIVDILGKEC